MYSEGHRKKQERHNYEVASLFSVIYRAHGAKDVKPEDFLPKEKTEQTTDQMLANAKAWNAALGGKVI